MPNPVKQFVWPVISGLLLALLLLQLFPAWFGLDNKPQQAGADSYASTVAAATPSVVNIHTSKRVVVQRHPFLNDPFFRQLFAQGQLGQQERVQNSLGSGVIVDTRGYVLTNHHVVANMDQILVSLYDGRQAAARVVGTDPETDLAVLKVELEGLTAIPFGDPDQARVGDVVLAIGNPFGFGHTVTQGIISAKGRYGLARLSTYQNFIQTDASINPGNSGGALVDSQGRLLGINTAIFSGSGGSQGIGLATPANLAMNVLKDIIKNGRVIRGWLGVTAEELDPVVARQYNIGIENGVLVTQIFRGGPAELGGLVPGDIITHINDTPINDKHAGLLRVAGLMPGDIAKVTLWRNGAVLELPITVGTRPSQNQPPPER